MLRWWQRLKAVMLAEFGESFNGYVSGHAAAFTGCSAVSFT